MINEKFSKFESDARNLLLDLSTDGMNPHGNMSKTHNTWPVALTIYNLPQGLFMKHKFLIMPSLISWPR